MSDGHAESIDPRPGRTIGRQRKELGLTPAEVAFYDALADNGSARELLSDPVLTAMARELTRIIRANATIDWNLRETVRAKLRSLVGRLLRKHKYPPDAQEKATETVLKQAEMLGRGVDGVATGPALLGM